MGRGEDVLEMIIFIWIHGALAGFVVGVLYILWKAKP